LSSLPNRDGNGLQLILDSFQELLSVELL
jgi:hypothetical protein